jgi:predicted transcriptional regulator
MSTADKILKSMHPKIAYSIKELMTLTGFKEDTVIYYMRMLEKHGLVEGSPLTKYKKVLKR